MKQLKYLFVLGILLFLPNIVYADETCSVSNIARLKKIASNISTTYDYTESIPATGYGNVTFTATISNVTKDIYVMKVDNYYTLQGTIYQGDENNQIQINDLSAGVSYHFVVFDNIGNECQDDLIYEFYITLPNYNKYYINPVCDKVPNYKYCQKWTNVNLTETEFVNSVNKYIKSLEETDDQEDTDSNNDKYSTFIEIMEFLSKYSIAIFGSIVLISAGGIIYLKKKDNFDFKLR